MFLFPFLLLLLLLLLVSPFFGHDRVALRVLEDRVRYLLRLVGECIIHLIVRSWCWIELLLLMLMLLDRGQWDRGVNVPPFAPEKARDDAGQMVRF